MLLPHAQNKPLTLITTLVVLSPHSVCLSKLKSIILVIPVPLLMIYSISFTDWLLLLK